MADSQYSGEEIRKAVDEAVIPYPENQKRGIKDFLRVNKRFRTHGPLDQKRNTISDRLWKRLSAS